MFLNVIMIKYIFGSKQYYFIKKICPHTYFSEK